MKYLVTMKDRQRMEFYKDLHVFLHKFRRHHVTGKRLEVWDVLEQQGGGAVRVAAGPCSTDWVFWGSQSPKAARPSACWQVRDRTYQGIKCRLGIRSSRAPAEDGVRCQLFVAVFLIGKRLGELVLRFARYQALNLAQTTCCGLYLQTFSACILYITVHLDLRGSRLPISSH